MQSEPVLLVGAILATFPGLTAAAHLLPGQWGQLAAAILTALSGGLIFYVRAKVSPNAPTLAAKKPPSVPPAALGLLAFLLVSCTPMQAQVATAGAGVVESACIAVVSIEAPGDQPLCVLGDELAIAVISYIASHAGTAPSVANAPNGTTVVAGDLYRELAARPGVLARKAKPPVCKPAQGQVAP